MNDLEGIKSAGLFRNQQSERYLINKFIFKMLALKENEDGLRASITAGIITVVRYIKVEQPVT
jgi:hypothetical protein